MYKIVFTKNAEKDKKRLSESHLEDKTKKLLDIMLTNPLQNPPPYEKLVGDLSGYYSRRINIKLRLIYRIIEKEKIIVVHSMWTH